MAAAQHQTIYEAFGAVDLQHRAYVGLRPRDPRFPPARSLLGPQATLSEAHAVAAQFNAGGGIDVMSLQLGDPDAAVDQAST